MAGAIIPTFSALTHEAVEHAATADFEGVPLKVVRPAHLAAIALSVGRAKDWTRILALLESESVTKDEISEIVALRGSQPSRRTGPEPHGSESSHKDGDTRRGAK